MSESVNFVTYCTDYNKVVRLQESLGMDLCVIHESQSAFTSDFKSKSSAIYLFMLQQAAESVWCVVDAYDVVVLNRDFEVPKNIDTTVTFNAETNCYPDASLAEKYPFVETSYKYLNAGAYIGTAKNIVMLLEKALPRIRPKNDDQLTFSQMYLEGTHGIAIDSNCELFQTLFQVPRELLHFKDGIFANLETNTKPSIVHGNGLSNMDFLWKN